MSNARVWLIMTFVCAIGSGGCVFYLNPLCYDDIANGEESDIDCGGGECTPCIIGRECGADADCENSNCVGGTCTPLPCENGELDGDETAIDCGGSCRPCSGGKACEVDADCFSSCAGGTCSALSSVAFAEAVVYPAGFKPYILLSGDLDNDDVLDLVSVNETENSLSVFLGQGDGTFTVEPRRLFPEGGDFYPTGGAVVDLDGDGFQDVVTANWHGNSVSVLPGLGDGTFGPFTDYPTADLAATQNLAVGRLDADDRQDVIAVNLDLGSATQFIGQPAGVLGARATYAVGGPGALPLYVAIADLNGDGKDDAVFVGEKTVVRLGNGDGTFGAETIYPLPGGMVVPIDVDLDGDVDLVTADRATDTVGVLLGRGDGTFLSPLISTTGRRTGPWALALADFNLDGVPDVVTGNFDSADATLLLGIGNGHFEAPVSAGETGAGSYGLVAADFDGDGKQDFATCNATTFDMKVTLNASQ